MTRIQGNGKNKGIVGKGRVQMLWSQIWVMGAYLDFLVQVVLITTQSQLPAHPLAGCAGLATASPSWAWPSSDVSSHSSDVFIVH